MAMPKIEVAPERIAEGKQLYEETDMPLHEIAARMGLRRRTLNNRIVEWNWTRRRYTRGGTEAEQDAVASMPAIRASAIAAPASKVSPAEPALPYAARLQRIVDGQLAVIERTLKVMGPASSAEAERTARTLATISRTVQEIKATAEGRMSSDEADDDPVPRDIDEFRRELARRIRGFIEARRNGAGGFSGEPEIPLD